MLKKSLTPRRTARGLVLVFGFVLFFRYSENFRLGAEVPADFKVYHTAVNRVKKGMNPYLPSEKSPYKYSLAALVPLQVLPEEAGWAWAIFKLFCLVAWGAAIGMGANFSRWREVSCLLVGLALSWKGLIETLEYGQIEFLVLFISTLAIWLWEKKICFAGLILGSLVWFKLPWGFLIFPFFIQSFKLQPLDRWRLIFGFLVGLIGLGILVPIFLFGIKNTFFWTQSWVDLLIHQPEELYRSDLNQSLWNSSARWIAMWGRVGFWMAGGCIFLSLYAFFKLTLKSVSQHSFQSPLREMIPWLILMQLMNPLGWRWGSLLLIGAPFAQVSLEKKSRLQNGMRVFLYLGVVILFILQFPWGSSILGLAHRFDFSLYGGVSVYWILILILCLENETPGWILRAAFWIYRAPRNVFRSKSKFSYPKRHILEH